MNRLFNFGQVIQIRVMDDGFSPDDYYIVSIVAIHKVSDSIIYYTSGPSGAHCLEGDVLDLHFEQSLDAPLCLVSGAEISVEVL